MPANYELAEIDYIKGMKYKDIADKYGVTINTVKSWKTRYEWSKDKKKGVHTKKEKVCTQNNRDAECIQNVMDNNNLTDKQMLFCLLYSKSFNATRSYQKAYGCSYESAMVSGPTLLGNLRVKEQIMKLKEERYSQALLKPEDIFQKYMDIAFADITDFLSFGTEEVPVMAMYGPVKDKKTGKIMTKEVNVVRFNSSDHVDGSILSEVKQGKEGASIKLSDRMKALDWLADHMNMGTEEQRLRVTKLKYEVGQLSNGAEGDTAAKDFLKAVNPTDEDIKALYENEVTDDAGEEKEE